MIYRVNQVVLSRSDSYVEFDQIDGLNKLGV